MCNFKSFTLAGLRVTQALAIKVNASASKPGMSYIGAGLNQFQFVFLAELACLLGTSRSLTSSRISSRVDLSNTSQKPFRKMSRSSLLMNSPSVKCIISSAGGAHVFQARRNVGASGHGHLHTGQPKRLNRISPQRNSRARSALESPKATCRFYCCAGSCAPPDCPAEYGDCAVESGGRRGLGDFGWTRCVGFAALGPRSSASDSFRMPGPEPPGVTAACRRPAHVFQAQCKSASPALVIHTPPSAFAGA
ncbi:hypothetical protein DESA109040_11335 [Deinococcus saxicola]